MGLLSIRNVGAVGIISDGYSSQQPVEAWHECRNATPLNTELEIAPTTQSILSAPLETADPYLAVMSWKGAGVNRLFVFGRTGIYHIASDTTVVSLLASPLSGADWPTWILGLFGNVPVANNSSLQDPPLYYHTGDDEWKSLPALSYGSVSGLLAKTLRYCGPYLVMLGVKKGSVYYPNMVKWGSSADPGTLPSTWNEGDLSNDAGEAFIGDNSVELFDLIPYRDFWVLYASDGVWRWSLTGDQFIFRKDPMFPQLGAFCQHCAVNTPKGQVALLSSDVILHDGYSYRSIVYGKVKEALYVAVSNWPEHVYLIDDVNTHEVMICIPAGGTDVDGLRSFGATLAYCWNWETEAWTTRELPNVASLEHAYPVWDSLGQVIDIHTEMIDSAIELIDAPVRGTAEKYLLGVAQWTITPLGNYSYQLIMANRPAVANFRGDFVTATLKREDLAILGQNRQGDWEIDVGKLKKVSRIIPVYTGDTTSLRCFVGAKMHLKDAIAWQEAIWNGQLSCFDCSISGRFLSIRFELLGGPWSLSGYDLDLVVLGDY